MKIIKISGFGDMDEYEVISHGNGWAYQIIRKEDGESVWLQDDDATAFGDVLNNTNSVYRDSDACAKYFYS